MATISFNAQIAKLTREGKIEQQSDLIKYLHH
jgi:hypothetical protein